MEFAVFKNFFFFPNSTDSFRCSEGFEHFRVMNMKAKLLPK